MSRIEPVHRGPLVHSLAHVRRNTLRAREADEEWNKAVVTVAMD
jgi:hypothetical protein